MATLTIRGASPGDAEELTLLARRAKAFWGYPAAWLAEWETALRFTPAYLRQHYVFVAELDDQLVGVLSIEALPEPEIAHLWVLPDHHGFGIGSALMNTAVQFSRSQGWLALRIESDPHAQTFYERFGATQIGRVAAPVAGTERFLPLLELLLV